jgi:hypothetical protein
MLAGWLLSRRVLRPIGALTAASSRLGAGDRGERVEVAGRDESIGVTSQLGRGRTFTVALPQAAPPDG